MRKPRVASNVLCLLVLLGSSAGHPQHAEHTWDYGNTLGPPHWGDLKPEFALCKTGHQQSPVDIRNAKKIELPAIRFDYKPSPLRIIDNGHTIMVNYDNGSSILVDGKKYTLKQFHFHHPSEEKIDGKSFDMSVHLVHSDDEGKLAVVAVLLQQGADNALIRELWKHLPPTKETENRLDNVQIDVSHILPLDRDYYTFSGSLTTPPCSEDVSWFVLKHPTAVSPQEIERFSQLYPNNARPTQPLYDRVVLESK
jgi:carbonic anhydrase